MKMAQMLIDSMTEKFDPEKFHDVYREQLLEMIEARAAGKTLPEAPAAVPRPDNVVNLMDVLAKSLEESKRRREAAAAAGDASGEDEDERKHSKPKKTSRRKSSAA
jgi:DNA end-binding protein Ku